MVDVALSPAIILAVFVSTSPGDSFLDRRFDLIDLQYFWLFVFRHDLALFVSILQDLAACVIILHRWPSPVNYARLPGFSLLPFWALHRSGGYLYFDLIFDSHQYPGGIDP